MRDEGVANWKKIYFWHLHVAWCRVDTINNDIAFKDDRRCISIRNRRKEQRGVVSDEDAGICESDCIIVGCDDGNLSIYYNQRIVTGESRVGV